MERFGRYASLICAVHCLVFPLLLAAVPSVSELLKINTVLETALVAIVVLVAGVMAWFGYKKHARRWPAALIAVGMFLLVMGLWFTPHAHEGDAHIHTSWLHIAVMVGGGVFLFLGQWRNSTLMQTCKQPNSLHQTLLQ